MRNTEKHVYTQQHVFRNVGLDAKVRSSFANGEQTKVP